MPRYTQTPEYQRREQRLRRKLGDMPAAERTVLNALAGEIGGEEMRKKVGSMQMAADKEARKTSLELGEKALGLKRRGFEFGKKQTRRATLIGLGEVGLGIYGGVQQRKSAQELARFRLSQRQYYEAQTPTPPAQRWGRWGGGQSYRGR